MFTFGVSLHTQRLLVSTRLPTHFMAFDRFSQ